MTRLFKIFVLIIVLAVPAGLQAQPGREKVKALRIAFITKKLELTTGESEKFWPVYNEYQDKLNALRANLRESYRERMNRLGEQEAEELYKLEIQSHQAEADLFKQYSERLRSVIGVKKLARLHIAEEEFKKLILENIKGQG